MKFSPSTIFFLKKLTAFFQSKDLRQNISLYFCQVNFFAKFHQGKKKKKEQKKSPCDIGTG
jgi:hypothetical protein